MVIDHVDTLILDHHLLRCEEGLSWLDRLSSETGHRVICAADFMERPRRLLEARRKQLYEEMPAPEGWHKAYARGDADTRCYRDYVDRQHLRNKRINGSTSRNAYEGCLQGVSRQ